MKIKNLFSFQGYWVRFVFGILPICCVLACCSVPAAAQKNNNAASPLVSETFVFPFYITGFDSISNEWPVLSNTENLLLVQDGDYILQRKSKLGPFAILGELEQSLDAFRLVSSLKLVKTQSEDGSIGLLFMTQAEGKGGFIFEINATSQYRLRQITPGGYVNLSGTTKDGGWSKSSLLKPLGIANLVEVRTMGSKYDIYLNNSLILSFHELAYKSGGIGFVIGPGSLGKIDFLYLFSHDKLRDPGIASTSEASGDESEQDVIELAESIIALKSTLNKVQAENDELKQRLEDFKGSEKELAQMKSGYTAQISQLEKQLLARQKSFDSLELINQDLLKYKDLVKGNNAEGGDLVISLSKKLKAEKQRADDLQKENEQLKEQMRLKNNSTGPGPGYVTPKTGSSGFNLPDEKKEQP